FLVRSIAGTRQAYNLEGPSVEEREFAVSSEPLTAADIERNTSTLQDARSWDWRGLEPQLQQIQGLRPYYTFSSVDIDRYQIDSAERQVIITARELDVTRLPAPAQVWVNLALKYTHGYGVVAVPVNEIDSRGNPVLWAHDIPIIAKKNLSVTHGEIYFGELTNDRVYLCTTPRRNSIFRKARPTPRRFTREAEEFRFPIYGASSFLLANSTHCRFSFRDILRRKAE